MDTIFGKEMFILQNPSPENQALLTHRYTDFICYFLLEYGNWHLKIFKITIVLDSPDKNIYATDNTHPLNALLIKFEMHGTTLNYFH